MEQLFPQVPSALGVGGTAPTACSSPQVLLVEPPGGALGEGAVRGAAFPDQGLAVPALHGPAGCAGAGAARGKGRKRQLKAKGDRPCRALPNQRNLCLVGSAHTRLPLSRKLGGPENQQEEGEQRGDSDGDRGVL